MGVAFVRVPGRLLRIMRTVVHLHDDGLFMRDGGSVNIAFRIAVEDPAVSMTPVEVYSYLPFRQNMN